MFSGVFRGYKMRTPTRNELTLRGVTKCCFLKQQEKRLVGKLLTPQAIFFFTDKQFSFVNRISVSFEFKKWH